MHILITCSLYIDTDNLHVDLENAKKKLKIFVSTQVSTLFENSFKKQQCNYDVRLLTLQMLHFGTNLVKLLLSGRTLL